MTYASIEEAWGGVSGSNQLTTPLHQRIHPIHLKQMGNPNTWKNTKDLYQCNYGSHDCNQIQKQNQEFNNQKKQIAQGTQPFPPGSPQPQNYTYLPQYPWYPWARYGYLTYPPIISNMWYSNPFAYNPYIAQQIQQRQIMSQEPLTPTNNIYQPQGFIPLPYKESMNPPRMYPPRTIKEAFGNVHMNPKEKAVNQGMIYFIFFLVALAVVLAIVMICLSCNKS